MVGDHWPGSEPAGYRIDALTGCGGAGVMNRATQLRLATCGPRRQHATGFEYWRRFEREARLAVGHGHEHVVPTYDSSYAEDVRGPLRISGPALWHATTPDPPPRSHRVTSRYSEQLDHILPTAIDDVIVRALAKRPADRFPDCPTVYDWWHLLGSGVHIWLSSVPSGPIDRRGYARRGGMADG
jgi:hypothetical protein